MCHKSCDTLTPLLINAAYMDLTEKLPDECSAQTKTSLSPVSLHRVKKQQFYANPLGSYPLNFSEKKYLVGMN